MPGKVNMFKSWEPQCSAEILHLRAKLLHDIRTYFFVNHVLEVETPLLCQRAGTDPYLDYFTSHQTDAKAKCLYLQSSPEFAMKRLLAANAQSIYQICKAFRRSESGRLHNPEFTLLEWYRAGFSLQQLMDDVESLLIPLLPKDHFPDQAERIPYKTVFTNYIGLDPLQFDLSQYQCVAKKLGYAEAIDICVSDHAAWLDFLFTHCVQTHLGKAGLCLVYDYPSCLPSLARPKQENALIVERVEVFIQGMELGNGFFELADVNEQIRRFERDIVLREQNGAPRIDMDERLLAALRSGLPDCSGIAIGLDRLLMAVSQKSSIDDVLVFSINNA